MPVFGIILGTILFKLEGYSLVIGGYSCQSPPLIQPAQFVDECNNLHHESNMLCLYMFVCAAAAFGAGFI